MLMGTIAEDEDSALLGDYMKLEEGNATDTSDAESVGDDEVGSNRCTGWWGSWWWWVKLGLIVSVVGLLAAVTLKWVGPFLMDKELLPILVWERKTFSKPVVALIVFGCLALLPCLLIPSAPSMWVGGMTFGYGYGFLLIVGGLTFGLSLPYFIGSRLTAKIHDYLERYTKHAAAIKLAGEGDWFHQCRVVALIRVSPIPNAAYNYLASATTVKYGPYLLGSLVGMIPEIFISIYTGILIRTLAEASHDRPSMTPGQIVVNILGLCTSVATTAIGTIYAKRRLKELQEQEQDLLQSSQDDSSDVSP